MSYVGGKHRVRKEICAVLVRACQQLGVTEVWEPFCGGLNITAELGRRGIGVHAFDFSAPAITLYKAIRLGWRPPPAEELTPTRWAYLKSEARAGIVTPLVAYAGFCASFNSVYFASFAGQSARGNFDSFRKRVRASKFVDLRNCSYPETCPPPGSVIYCDPPYANTDVSAYRSLSKEQRVFDSEAFWEWCAQRSAEGSKVFVSEYTAPANAIELRRFTLPVTVGRDTSSRATDILFTL